MTIIRTGLLLLLAGLMGCGRTSQDPAVAARVNGRDILRSEIETQFRLRTQTMPQPPGGDAANLLKLEILRELIVEEIMMQKAEELKLQLADSELEAELRMLRGETPEEEFQKVIKERGWSEEDLRKEIRRNLTMQKLVQSQLSAKIQVTPEEMSQFYEENKERFHVQELEYRIGQIVVTANPDMPVANLRGDKAKDAAEASQKIQMLADRLKAGEAFEQLAREYSEDPQTAPSGGDLGYHPVSTLNQYMPRVPEQLEKMKVGDVTSVIQTSGGYLILKLLARRDPGQLELTNPEVNQTIREELQAQKQQLLSTAYSEHLRNESEVKNFLAEEFVAQLQ